MQKRNHLLKYVWFRISNKKLRFSNESMHDFSTYMELAGPFVKYRTERFEDFISGSFNNVPDGAFEEAYLVHYDLPVVIEPYNGWALNKKGEVLSFSLPHGESSIWTLHHFIYYKSRKYISIKKAVSIRYNWFNYWHFMNDIIGQLYLLELLNFDKTIPLLIPKKAMNFEYVQQFMQTDFARSWQWIVQDEGVYVKLEEAYFCKYFPNVAPHFLLAKKIFSIPNVVTKTKKRIYIHRPSTSRNARTISNFSEIRELLLNNDFEIVNAEGLDIYQQAELFVNADVVLGPHGAGLTNILFSQPSSTILLEIFPRDFAPANYYWLACELGIKYDAFGGEALYEGAFRIPPVEFEYWLNKRLLND